MNNTANITNSQTLNESFIATPAIEAAEDSFNWLYLAIGVVVAILFLLFRKSKAANNKKEIAIVGERGSGKTQLLMTLTGGPTFQTVPSISNNSAPLEIGNTAYRIIDFIGDNVSREEVVSEMTRFKAIVVVADGADSRKLSDTALFLYRILISKNYQKDPCPLILFLSKADLPNFHGEGKLVKRI